MSGNPLAENYKGRNGRVWHMYAVLSMTQQAIADELGLTQPAVSVILKEVRKELPKQTREEIAVERAELLRAATSAMMPRTLEGNARSAEVLMKILEREAKLLGLDAVVKSEVNANITYQVAGVDPKDLV